MTTTRKEQIALAAAGELKPCALCGRAKWFHSLAAHKRRELNWRDDNHAFRRRSAGSVSSSGERAQMRLPFQTAEPLRMPEGKIVKKAKKDSRARRREGVA